MRLAWWFLIAAACGDNLSPATHAVRLEQAARTASVEGCTYASPVIAGTDDPLVIIATTAGIVAAYEPDGTLRWQTTVAATTSGDRAWIAATPVVVDDHLVIAWQDADAGDHRHAHHVAVLDARTGALDETFPTLTLAATKPAVGGGTVSLNDATAFSRSRLVAIRRPGDTLGTVYVSLGNIQDIQPWHGWVFEIDLDRWRTQADAISGVLLTTPEADCGPAGDSGSDDMVCGGGVWAPSGPIVVGDDPELWIPTGNGQLDLGRGDYANTIMRTRRGLAFDPHCDATCADFDPHAPSAACMASCADLFIPRLRDGEPALSPPNGLCDGKTFLECYARLDLDLGASSPAVVDVEGTRLAVLPAKDGAVYLFDAAHFGTLYDRLEIRAFCGSNGGTCTANWAGTMVTQPAVAVVDGTPIALVPTFYFDSTNPAGVVGIAVERTESGFGLRERWSAPGRDADEARVQFREHTGRIAIVDAGGTPYGVIADPGPAGVLYAIDARTGDIADRATLDGPGHKYIEPAVRGRRVFVTSCDDIFDGPSHLEGWDLLPP